MENDTGLLNTKRGYLNNDFIFFNLQDAHEMKIESHYHDFNKIVIFISGKVTYYIEGISYKLKPWDILLINRDTIHKPVIDITSPYKRIVLWIKPSLLEKYNDTNYNLLTCFELAYQHKLNLLRMTPEILNIIQSILFQINDAYQNPDFGDELLQRTLLLQLIVYLNRMSLNAKQGASVAKIESDKTICSILQYIDINFADDLSIEKLASVFFLSKYYLMRKFKHHTGYSIHNYLLQKRLIAANQFIRSGESIITACMASGFHDYSNFTRAYKKMYGLSPKNYGNFQKQE